MPKVEAPMWMKLVLAGSASAGLVVGGQKLATDAPIHFAVVGEAPKQADGWRCAPEGGIVGAPMVCRPMAASRFDTATDSAVETK